MPVFFPGREPPLLTQKPTLQYELQPHPNLPDGVTMDIIAFAYNYVEPDHKDIFYDVTFLIGDKAVFTVEDLQEDDFPAYLKETDFKDFQDNNHEPNLGYRNNVSHHEKGEEELSNQILVLGILRSHKIVVAGSGLEKQLLGIFMVLLCSPVYEHEHIGSVNALSALRAYFV